MTSSENANVERFAAEIEQELLKGGIDHPDARGVFILDAVRRLLSRIGQVGPDVKNAILQAALKVYDAFNTPVPDAIETPIKVLLRPTVESMLRHILGLDA